MNSSSWCWAKLLIFPSNTSHSNFSVWLLIWICCETKSKFLQLLKYKFLSNILHIRSPWRERAITNENNYPKFIVSLTNIDCTKRNNKKIIGNFLHLKFKCLLSVYVNLTHEIGNTPRERNWLKQQNVFCWVHFACCKQKF